MRVAIVLPFPVFGAAEDYALLLAHGLIRCDVDVVVVHDTDVALPSRPTGPPVPHHPVPGRELRHIPSLTRHLRRLGPDIVHVNQVFLPGMAAGARTRHALVVVTAHNPAVRPAYSKRGAILARWAARRMSAWIVLTPRNAVLLSAEPSLEPRRIHVIPPGLPTGRFDQPMSRVEARSLLGLSADAYVVGTVGRLAKQKRHDLLIRAASICATDIEELRLVIFGEGELRSETESLADDLLPDRVVFAGQQPDVPRLLPAIDVFCLTSDYEGLSFALLEAMATGLPIVATDVQGSGEALTDGRTGLLAPAGSADGIASAISRLHADPDRAAAIGRRARETYMAHYTDDLMVERTMSLYGSLIDETNRT